MCSILKRF